MEWIFSSYVVALLLIGEINGLTTSPTNITIDIGSGNLGATFAPALSTPSPAVCSPSFVLLLGSCYKGMGVTATWPEAFAYCEAFGAKLATINSQEEQIAIQNYLASLTGPDYTISDQYWIAANDFLAEGDWKWAITQESVIYTNWNPGSPDNGGRDNRYSAEHCVELSRHNNWRWNDNGCEEHKYFLCQKQPE